MRAAGGVEDASSPRGTLTGEATVDVVSGQEVDAGIPPACRR